MNKPTDSENVWKRIAADLQDRLDPDHIETSPRFVCGCEGCGAKTQ